MQIIALIVLTILFLLYTIGINYKNSPTSLSEGYYILEGTLFGQAYFSITFFLMGILFMIVSFDLFTTDLDILIFLSGAGVSLIGATPLFKEAHVKKIHYTGAFVAAVASQIWIVLSGDYIISLYIWIPFIVWAFIQNKKKILLLELACFINIIIQLSNILLAK